MDNDTLSYFIFFLAGAVASRIFGTLISIGASYRIFKFTEFYCVTLMVELEGWRHQAITVVKLCYEEAGRMEEFAKVEQKIHEKFFFFQQNILAIMKSKLPYQTKYDGILEGYKQLQKEKDDEQRGQDNTTT